MLRSMYAGARNALRVAWVLGVLGFPLAAGAVAEEEPVLDDSTAESISRETGSASPMDARRLEHRVTRSAFTTAVVDREPVDTLAQLSNDARSVSYFTELRGLDGETVTHRWEFDGEVVAEIPFEVGSARWRVHSTKTLDPARLGEWSVSVLDAQGRKLSEERLRYVAAGAGLPAEPAAPAAAGSESE